MPLSPESIEKAPRVSTKGWLPARLPTDRGRTHQRHKLPPDKPRSAGTIQGTGTLMIGSIPSHGSGHGGGEIPTRPPTELMMHFVDLQVKPTGFMRSHRIGQIFPITWPMLQGKLHKLPHWPVRLQRRSKVEGTGIGVKAPSPASRSANNKYP